MSSNYINDRVMKNMKKKTLVEFYNAYIESSNEIIENLTFEKKEDDVKVSDASESLNSDILPDYRVDIHRDESAITLTFKGDAEIRRLREFINDVDAMDYGEYYALNSSNAMIYSDKRIRIVTKSSINGFGTNVTFVLSGYPKTRLVNGLRKMTLMNDQ